MISTVIPTYNRIKVIERAVNSVLNQDTTEEHEIIIVDDGSTDGTETYIKNKYRNEIESNKIKYIKIPHSGVSRARNVGITNSRGEWIAFLDSDDEWLKQKLTSQMNYLRAHPEYLICHTDEIWIKNGKRINQGKKHLKQEGWFFEPSLKICLISPSSVIINKKIFEAIGLFDESFKVVEDYELWLRITSRYKVGYIDEKLTIKYGGHSDQLSSQINGIEKYRMNALEKFIKENMNKSEMIGAVKLAMEEYIRKYKIYINGCIKRGKYSEINSLKAKKDRLIDLLTAVVV